MSLWVLDATVLVKTLFVEPEHEIAVGIWVGDGSFLAPASALMECANAALKKVRHEGLPEAAARDGLRQVGELPLEFVAVHAFYATSLFDVARSAGVTAHDAVYLLLAEDRHGRVLTADKRLLRAVKNNVRWKDRVIALADWPG